MALNLIRNVVRDMVEEYAAHGITLCQHDKQLIRAVAASVLDCFDVDLRKVESSAETKCQHIETGNPRRISAQLTSTSGHVSFLMGGIVASNGDSRQSASAERIAELRASYEKLEPLGTSPFDKLSGCDMVPYNGSIAQIAAIRHQSDQA